MTQETKKVEKKEEVETKVDTKVERKLKGFDILEKEGARGIYYNLEIETYGGKKATMFLTETQKEMIDIVGQANCFVDIETRKSKDNRVYEVIALHIGDEDTQDFFPKDRAFLPLAKLHYKKR